MRFPEIPPGRAPRLKTLKSVTAEQRRRIASAKQRGPVTVTVADSPWFDVTPGSGWSLHSSQPLQARVASGWVALSGGWTRAGTTFSTGGWVTVASLPAVIPAPDKEWEIPLVVSTANCTIYGKITTARDVQLYLFAGTVGASGNVYFATAWPVP